MRLLSVSKFEIMMVFNYCFITFVLQDNCEILAMLGNGSRDNYF